MKLTGPKIRRSLGNQPLSSKKFFGYLHVIMYEVIRVEHLESCSVFSPQTTPVRLHVCIYDLVLEFHSITYMYM